MSFAGVGMVLLRLLAFTLSVEPNVYHFEFPAARDNSSIILVIMSDTNQTPYFAFQSVPILADEQTSLDIPRHYLPHGGYHLVATLMQWHEGDKAETPVDWADTIILVN